MATNILDGILSHITSSLIASTVVGVWLYNKGQRDRSIDSILSSINDMAGKGVEYWSIPETDPRSKLLASQVKQLSVRIGKELLDINSHYYSFRPTAKDGHLLISFRKSITDGQFEVKSREVDLRRIETIEIRRADLVSAVRKARKFL